MAKQVSKTSSNPKLNPKKANTKKANATNQIAE